MENIYDNYIYLKELDSVHMADENNVAEKILFDTLVFSEKSVVLTYNQIADSEVFLNILHESDIYAALLDFFKEKKLLVNRFKKDMNLSYYIQKNFRENTTFISTYFSFLNIYSEDKINIIYKGMNESFKYGDSLYLKNVMPDDISEDHQKQLINYINFMLTVNLYMNDYECYILPKDDQELIGHEMKDYMYKILFFLEENESYTIHPFKQLIEKCNSKTFTRSECYKIRDAYIEKQYHEILTKLINLAYNYTLGYSISNIYTDDHLKDDLTHIFKVKKNKQKKKKNYKWKSGYRVVSITNRLKCLFSNSQWKTLLIFCPLVEMFKLIFSIGMGFIVGAIFTIIGSFDVLWKPMVFSAIISVFYHEVIGMGKSKLLSVFPEWIYTSNPFEQLVYCLGDAALIYFGGKNRVFK